MNASIELACAFPPKRGLRGACTTIRDLSWFGLAQADRVFVRTKREAVRLIVSANMEAAQSRGKGYKSAKRAARIGEQVEWELRARILRMQKEQRRVLADARAEAISESRSVAHHYRQAVNE